MAIFRVVREEYEKAIRMGHLTGLRPKVETAIPAPEITEDTQEETKPETVTPTGSNNDPVRKRRKSKVE
jgi:hypothetical protein